MAKVQTVEVADELKNLQRGALEQRDRFILSVVQGHKSLPSDARKKVIKEQSLFGFLSPIWRALTTTEKNVWKSAGVYSGITNWQLFISDNAARIRGDLELDIPPSDLWQVRAGQLLVESPATEMILKQDHPQSYWVAQKIVGASWKNELVRIDEVFGFPLDLELRYKSNLSVAPGYVVSATAGTISGIVSLSSVAVQNVTVRCIRQSDNVILTEQTTDSTGAYIFTGLDVEEVYHVAVEYETGGTKYNALSFWDAVSLELNFELSVYSVPDGDAVDFAVSEYTLLTPTARYYASVRSSYQGIDRYTDCVIQFDAVTDWKLGTASISSVIGHVIGYTLYMEIVGYRGELLFDNIRAVHGGTNWALDPRCDTIDKTFTKAFAVVPPFWVPVSLPSGATFSSQFPPSL